MKHALCFFLLASMVLVASSQEKYVPVTDSLVARKLAAWQDLKFGLFMHWGTYSQWGVVESWSICPEDEGWTQRRGPFADNYFAYKKAYENLQYSFNPVKFNPDKWAKAAFDAGMRYVVFTTKHHDGFCMFDTKQTDYRITSPGTPFSKNPRSNVALEIFNSFRAKGFMTGAYFSKPDWHNENYWWPYFPPLDRNVNYDPEKYPDRWQAFRDFTYHQIEELMRDYGPMDILWLDGGWVRPLNTVDRNVEWQRGIKYDQDIDMPKIARRARELQPGLIIVDRTVTGPYENYTTPEQQVPEVPIDHPWETCMTMGNSWSFVPNDTYKSPQQLVQLLVKIVSRGGNFLLNIGPGPDGDWDPVAYERLSAIGAWMKVNGEGIYHSEPVAPYSSGPVYFTRNKTDGAWYAFYLPASEDGSLPDKLEIDHFPLKKVSKISILGAPSKLKWTISHNRLTITNLRMKKPASGGSYAWCFKIIP